MTMVDAYRMIMKEIRTMPHSILFSKQVKNFGQKLAAANQISSTASVCEGVGVDRRWVRIIPTVIVVFSKKKNDDWRLLNLFPRLFLAFLQKLRIRRRRFDFRMAVYTLAMWKKPGKDFASRLFLFFFRWLLLC